MDFRQQPRKNEGTSWLWAGLWLFLIYASIPLARTVQEAIRDRGLAMLFLWVTLLSFFMAAGWIIRAVMRRELSLSPTRTAILVAILSLFCWLTWTLRANPEEAFHFVQYGVLSILLFRAFSHRLADASIYFVVTAIGSVCGILDELIQWLVPRRYFDFRDIGINSLAVVMIQLALAMGIRPPFVEGYFSSRGLRIGFAWVITAFGLLLLSLIVTSPFFDKTDTRHFPKESTLGPSLARYGHGLANPAPGMFPSPLSALDSMPWGRVYGGQSRGFFYPHPDGRCTLKCILET